MGLHHNDVIIPVSFRVLIRIYGGTTNINGNRMYERFNTNVRRMFEGSDELVVGYPRQPTVMAFNLSTMGFDLANALHPGALSADSVDPTLYPVIIGVYPGVCEWCV